MNKLKYSLYKNIKQLYVKYKLLLKRHKLKKINGVILKNNVVIDIFTSLEQHISIGNNCNVASSNIGIGTYISDYSILRHTKVGRFCAIADNVRTGQGSHPTNTYVSIHPAFFSPNKQAGFSFTNELLFDEMPKVKDSNYNVIIGNDVWIGSGAVILDGITIGDGAIIGANAVVTKDIEPYSINVGVPARCIKYRFEKKEIDFLLKFRWWNKDFNWIKKNSKFFLDINYFIKHFEHESY